MVAELLPMSVRTDTARRRAVKLLMSVSVPRLDVAVMLEQTAYKIFVSSSSTFSGISAVSTGHVTVTPKYTACITRITFALLVSMMMILFPKYFLYYYCIIHQTENNK